MKKKTTRPIRNWKQYNAALKQRGSLTFWISDEAIRHWTTDEKTGKRGASQRYTALAIETMAMVQAVFDLSGRQCEGFLNSVFVLMKLTLTAPEHSTLSRRRGQLTLSLPVKARRKARHLVVDATGVKVYGEGEWKVRQHGWRRRRTWRKLHLAVDAATHEIVAAAASTNDVSDGEMLPVLLAETSGKIGQVSADGAYDQRKCYAAIRQAKARAVIPPRRRAKIWQHGNCREERKERDENLRAIRRQGRKKWKEESGYHRRSLAETSVCRYKTICGERVRTRKEDNQFAEMLVKCVVLNRMTHLGMPRREKAKG